MNRSQMGAIGLGIVALLVLLPVIFKDVRELACGTDVNGENRKTMSAVPVLEGARLIRTYSVAPARSLTHDYFSSQDVEQIQAFYDQELRKDGWSPLDVSVWTDGPVASWTNGDARVEFDVYQDSLPAVAEAETLSEVPSEPGTLFGISVNPSEFLIGILPC